MKVCSWEHQTYLERAATPLEEFSWISPAACEILLVKDEIAQPAHEAASVATGVPIRGADEEVAFSVVGGGNTVSGMVEANLRMRARYASIVLLAWSRTSFSLSIKHGHRAGNIRFAQSSSLNASFVTASAINAAFLAWTKGSRRDRVKAAIRTFDLVLTPRFLDILPRQIVVFVRMPGCSSFEVFARYLRSSPLMVLSDSFPIIVKTALTVCSRTTGAKSVKPVTYISLANTFRTSRLKSHYHVWEYLIIHDLLRQSVDHLW